MSAAIDIKDILVAAGVGTFASASGWSIAISREPARPHQVITIYRSGSWFENNPKFKLDYPSIQIRIRGNPDGYVACEAKAEEIKNVLLGIDATVVNDTDYRGIWMSGDTFQLPYDDNDRPIVVQNYRIVSEPSSTVSDNREPLST